MLLLGGQLSDVVDGSESDGGNDAKLDVLVVSGFVIDGNEYFMIRVWNISKACEWETTCCACKTGCTPPCCCWGGITTFRNTSFITS